MDASSISTINTVHAKMVLQSAVFGETRLSPAVSVTIVETSSFCSGFVGSGFVGCSGLDGSGFVGKPTLPGERLCKPGMDGTSYRFPLG